ncbi:MAG TPA: hypothetical protein VF100_01400 [Thermoanaerobaculia bacterium]
MPIALAGPSLRRSAIPTAFALALLVASAIAPPAAAQDAGGLSIGARAATTGFGVELAIPVASRLGLRAAVTGGSWDVEVDSENVTYDGSVDLASVLAVADLHPFAGGFRLSFGALVHDNTLEGSAPVRELLLDEGITPPPGVELGRLVAEAGVDPVAPYAGIGWGRAPRRGARGLSASLDLGVAWHGEPDVDVRYAGPLPLDVVLGQPVVDQLRAEEEAELEAELADYDLFPVVGLTISYRF